MARVIHIVITAVCGRWYATPVHEDESAGGSTSFDSRQAARDLADRHVALARHGRQRAEVRHPGEQLHVIEGELAHGVDGSGGLRALQAVQGPFASRAVSRASADS